MVGTVLGVSVHGDWLFGHETAPDRDTLVEALTRLTVAGLSG